MKTTRLILRPGAAASVICLLALVSACEDSTVSQPEADPSLAVAGGTNNVVVILKGTATGELRDIDGVEMACFDVDLVDPMLDRVVGQGTDCLDLSGIAGAILPWRASRSATPRSSIYRVARSSRAIARRSRPSSRAPQAGRT